MLDIVQVLQNHGFDVINDKIIGVKLIAYTDQFNKLLAILAEWGKNKKIRCQIKQEGFNSDEGDDAWYYKEGQEYVCWIIFHEAESWSLKVVCD